MLRKFLASAVVALGVTSTAYAQSCPANPYTLTNGATADADQVMTNFNNILSCINNRVFVAPSFTGPIGVGTTSPRGTLSLGPATGRKLITYDNGSTLQSGIGVDLSGYSREMSIFAGNDGTTGPAGGHISFGLMTNGVSYTEYMRVAQNGYVGINTPNPANTLDVNGSIRIESPASLNWSDSSGYRILMQVQSDNNFVFYNTDPGGTSYPVFSQVTRASNPTFVFYSPISYPSDLRLKKNVAPVTGALAMIQQLRPVRYDWRTKSERSVGQTLQLPESQRQIGLIAQELQQVVPEAVSEPIGKEGLLTIKPDVLIPLLIQAIKEQQVEIDQLKAQIAAK